VSERRESPIVDLLVALALIAFSQLALWIP